MNNIRLHPKFGLNPTMTTCYYCLEPKEVLLVGSNVNEFQKAALCSPDGQMISNIGVIDLAPCQKCKEFMKQGIILISIRNGEEKEFEKKIPNPYRTGGWIVVKEDLIRRLITDERLVESILTQRFCFVPDEVWNLVGLPRSDGKEEK